MKIEKIKIARFKSYYEPYELDFNDVKGLWKISGSVGTGKTTIGEAILFGLFGTVSGKNLSELVSWGRKNAIVEIWCVSNSRNIYIKRDITSHGTSSIYVEIDGEELVFTNKRDAQKQLEEEYFDVSRVTMELLCIISFNNFKSLATLNTADTKKFLDQVLGFYTLTQYADACKLLKSENMNRVNNVDRQISQLTAQIEKLEELSNMEIIDGDIDECNNLIKNIKDEMLEIGKQYDNILGELNKKDKELRASAAKIQALGNAKNKEITFIEKGVCPTCGAPIDQSQLEIKKQERDVFLNQYKEIANDVKENNRVITENTSQYHETLAPMKKQIEEYKVKIVKLKEQANRINLNKDAINKLIKEQKAKNKELNGYIAEDANWERLYGILANDVRMKILESFIPALNKNIMKYAQQLHQPYIVSFDNSFKCSVSLCGYNNDIPLSSLSTGQLKTVDMMIILGILGTVIGSASANVIFLDELFSNLDGNLRNDMCSVLKNFITDGDTIFVISHQDLDDRYFNGTIKLHIDYKGQFEKHTTTTIVKNEIE